MESQTGKALEGQASECNRAEFDRLQMANILLETGRKHLGPWSEEDPYAQQELPDCTMVLN